MTAPIARAFVEVLPEFRNYNTRLKTEIRESTALAQHGMSGIGNSAAATSAHVAHETEGMFTRMKDSIREVAKFALPVLGAVEGFKFFKESIDAARQEEKQLRQTEQVIKTTGGAAHVTAKDVEELAKKQSLHTGITQTQIRANENLLLTFTGIQNKVGKGNDIFNQATVAVEDLSVAIKEGPRAAAIQLGKALNDPINGLTALKRVGVAFTDTQKAMVKAMVQGGEVNALNAEGFNVTLGSLNKLAKDGYGGDIDKAVKSLTDQLSKSQKAQYDWLVKGGHAAAAQKMILREVQKEFGGSAAAQATAGEKMSAAWETVRVEVGNKLLPIINKVEGFITTRLLPGVIRMFDEAGKGEGVFGALSKVFHATLDVLKPLVSEALAKAREAWPMIQKALGMVIPALEETAHWLKEHGTLVRTVAVAVVAFWAAWKGYKIIMAVRDAVLALNLAMDANPIGVVVAAIAALAAGFYYAYTHSETFRKIVARVFAALKEGAAVVVQIAKDIWDFGKAIVNGLVTGFHAVIAFFADFPHKVLQFFRNAPTWLVDAGVWLIKGYIKGVIFGFVLLYEGVKLYIKALIYLFINAPKWLWAAGKFLIGGLWAGIKLAWKGIVAFFLNVPILVARFFVAAHVWLFHAGVAVLTGLWNGVQELYKQTIAPWFKNIIVLFQNFFNNAITWLLRYGRHVMQGLWNGIQAVWDTVAAFFHNIRDWLVRIFTDAVDWLLRAGRHIITGLWHGIQNAWDTVRAWFGSLPATIKGYLTGAIGWLYNGGKNILTGMLHGLEKSFSSIGNWFKSLPGKILHFIGVHSPPKWAVEAGKWIIKAVIQGAASTLKDAMAFFHNFKSEINAVLGTIGLGGTLGLDPVSGSASPTTLQGLAGKMFAGFGWGGAGYNDELQALIKLWNQESGWRWNATNPTSGAYGIPQSLPATKMASAGSDWRTNPLTQIRWGLGYIKQRYGDPIGAWAHEIANNWYDQGAWQIPRQQLAMLHRGEMVVPQPQAQQFRDAMQQASAPAGGDGIDYEKLGRAVAKALSGMALGFDSQGMVRFIGQSNGLNAIRGVRQ